MTPEEFRKKMLSKLLGMRKLSEQFYKDNPDYDVSEDGYIAVCIQHNAVSLNTDPGRGDYINIYKETK